MAHDRKAIRFFFDNAGYVVGRRFLGAAELAMAERAAENAGAEFIWEEDVDPDFSWLDGRDENGRYLFSRADREGRNCHSVYCCRLVLDGHTLASLCGIFDPDNNYQRVVQAELASEALGALENGLTGPEI